MIAASLRSYHALSELRRRLPASVRLERAALAGKTLAGACPVCGQEVTNFEKFSDNLRESGHCSSCGASNRQRQMALMLRRDLRLPLMGPLAPLAGCTIYNTEANGPVHTALAIHPAYIASEFWGDKHTPGSVVNGIRNEDLQSLSFTTGSIDIVLSSDVLEHVPDAYRAHREIHRVLRRGGRHIFTAPFREARTDDVRAIPRRGKPVLLAPPLYHGDPVRPDQGVLVWRIFGYEMLTRLHSIGFSVRLHRLYVPACGILGPGAIVFVARKI